MPGMQFDRATAMVNEHTSPSFPGGWAIVGSTVGNGLGGEPLEAPELISVQINCLSCVLVMGSLFTFVACWEEEAKRVCECV